MADMVRNTVLHIEGMSCAHCVHHVKEALEAVAGVRSAAVSLEAKEASVEHDEGVTSEALATAVEEAGYDVTR